MTTREAPLRPELMSYVSGTQRDVERISAERRERLHRLASFVSERTASGRPAKLLFICTHNSRRSHTAQIWAQAAAHHLGIPELEAFSGGTEATAFNPRAVAALRRAGFLIDSPSGADNPVYEVRFAEGLPAMRCFSKTCRDPANPQQDFAAVMTCSTADESCPLVPGAAERISIPYDDPKELDGSDRERSAYDDCCRRIAAEMLYAFSIAASHPGPDL